MTKVTTGNSQNITTVNRFELIKPNLDWTKKVYNENTLPLHLNVIAAALAQKVTKAVFLVLAFLAEIFIKNPAILAYDLGALIGNKLFPKRVITPISPTIAKSEGTISSLDNKKTDAAPQEKTAGPAGRPGPAEAPIFFANAPSLDLAHPSPQAPQGLSTPISSDRERSGTPFILQEVPQGPASIIIPSPGSAFVSFPRALSTSPVSPAASDDLALLPAPTSVVAVAAQVLSPIAVRVPSPAPAAQSSPSPVAAQAQSPVSVAESAPLPIAQQVEPPVAPLSDEKTVLEHPVDASVIFQYTSEDLEEDLEAFTSLGLSDQQIAQIQAIMSSEIKTVEGVLTFKADVFFGAFGLPVPDNLDTKEFLTQYLALTNVQEDTKQNIELWLNQVQALARSYSATTLEIVEIESVAAQAPSPATVPAPESAASPANVPVDTSTSPMHFEELSLQVAAQMPSPVAVVETVASPVAVKAPSPVPVAMQAPSPVAVVETVASPVAAKAPSPAPAAQSAPAPVAMQAPSPVAVVETVASPVAAKTPSPVTVAQSAPAPVAMPAESPVESAPPLSDTSSPLPDEDAALPEFTQAIAARSPVRSPLWARRSPSSIQSIQIAPRTPVDDDIVSINSDPGTPVKEDDIVSINNDPGTPNAVDDEDLHQCSAM